MRYVPIVAEVGCCIVLVVRIDDDGLEAVIDGYCALRPEDFTERGAREAAAIAFRRGDALSG